MPEVGVDDWVRQSNERREQRTGPIWKVVALAARLNWWQRFAILLVLAALLPVVLSNGYLMQVAVNTLLLSILAVGLNVAVGWAGLFDLGYVAFYGCGAYIFALLASNQLGHGFHLPSALAVIVAIAVTALIGFLVGLPSKRVNGDYLAILTLFFGQAFTEVTNNVGGKVLGGPNGIPAVDPIGIFGANITTTLGYFYLLLVLLALLVIGLHRVERGRIGRAWNAVRGDALAAKMMTVPVSRVKIIAFVVSAGIAALAGSIFAASQSGVYPTSFTQPVLVLMYTALVVGGMGTIQGAIGGAIVLTAGPELLRSPDNAGYVFYGLIIVAILWKLRPWRPTLIMLASVIVGGFVIHLVVGAVAPDWTSGLPQSGGPLGAFLRYWVVLPSDPIMAGDIGFVLLIAIGLLVTTLKGWQRTALIGVAVYLAVFVWEARLAAETTITRQILIGVLLVGMMAVRPQGLFGKRKAVLY